MNKPIQSEIETRADFSHIRYGQCWEDAATLRAGLNIQPGEHCLSVASAGDNTLALLIDRPAKVYAIDLNSVQLFCLELRIAAYQQLTHEELLELMGSIPSQRRVHLYEKCRSRLATSTAQFWDTKTSLISQFGIAGTGKFERYFRIFKNYVLPLAQKKQTVHDLFVQRDQSGRENFYYHTWNNWRWRALIRLFFSQTVMGRLGRDPAFFRYIEGSFSDHISKQIVKGLCSLSPTENPYLRWILTGTHGDILPESLQQRHFTTIRSNLDALELHVLSTETFCQKALQENIVIHKHNLSNIFEYMAEPTYRCTIEQLADITPCKGRLLYWNMLVPRTSPAELRSKLLPLTEEANRLHAADKAFFYSRLIIEEKI